MPIFRISQLRKELGITQEDLAKKIDSSRVYISHVEQGRRSLSLETLEKIAKALKVEMKDLFS